MVVERASTKTIRQILPSPVKGSLRHWYRYSLAVRYRYFLRGLYIKQEQILILSTIAKSGTHYVKFLFANYLKLASGNSDGPVTPKEMNLMLPNIWHRAYAGGHPYRPSGGRDYKKPTSHLALLGLHDMPRSHYEYLHSYWKKSPVLHLYRNPLDYAVSIYHYKYQNRTSLTPDQDDDPGESYGPFKVSDPVEALDLRFDDYVRMYLSYRELARASRPQLLRISYEDLMRYPEACLRIIIRWLGVEPDPSHIESAARYSSVGTVKQLEGAKGAINPSAKNFTGKFARDGSIGQWKKYFSAAEVDRFREKFSNAGISLDEFTLEP